MTDTKANNATYPCKPLGKAIKAARKRKKLSQAELMNQLKGADKTGLFKAIETKNEKTDGTNTLTQYETGRRTPSPDRLRRLAFCLGVTTDDLLGMYDERFFYRIINSLNCLEDANYQYKADLTISDEIQSEDEWPNDGNRKLNLQVTVTNTNSPLYLQTLTPNIQELKNIRESSWMQYENDLKKRIDKYLYAQLASDDKTLLSDLSLYIALASIQTRINNEDNQENLTAGIQKAFADMVTEFRFYELCNYLQKERETIFTVFGKKVSSLIFFFYFTGLDPLEQATALILHGLKKRVDILMKNRKDYDFRQSFHKGIDLIHEEFANQKENKYIKNRKDWSQKKYNSYNDIFEKLYESNCLTEILNPGSSWRPNEFACHELILNAARSFCNIPIVSHDDHEKRIRHFSEMNPKDIEDIKNQLLDKLAETDSDYLNRCKTWELKSDAPDYIWYDLIEECEKIRKKLYPAAPPAKGKPPKQLRKMQKDIPKDDNR